MAVSILFGCQTWVIQGTTEILQLAAVAASEGKGFAVIALVGCCRGLRKPASNAQAKSAAVAPSRTLKYLRGTTGPGQGLAGRLWSSP